MSAAALGAVSGFVATLLRPGAVSGLFGGLSGPGLWAAGASVGAFIVLAAMALLLALRAPRRVPASTAERIGALANAPVLAVAPLLRSRDLRQVAPDLRYPAGLLVSAPQSLFAQALRTAAGRILKWRAGEAGLIVSIIAAMPREGASSVALSLARAAAATGKRVVIVDADPRERTLSHGLEMDAGRGIWTALEEPLDAPGGGSLIDVHLSPDPYTSLMVLPQGDGSSMTREIYGHARFAALLANLKQRFDLVVLDCGPVGLVDGRMTAVQGDAVVVVTQWNATLARHLMVARRGLERLGGVVPGIIVNGASEAAARQWLGDPEAAVHAAL